MNIPERLRHYNRYQQFSPHDNALSESSALDLSKIWIACWAERAGQSRFRMEETLLDFFAPEFNIQQPWRLED